MNIKVINVTKTFKTLTKSFDVCKNISMDINQGDFVAIVGYTGSGKSTLLNIIGAILTPTTGQVYYDAFNVKKSLEKSLAYYRRRFFSYIFQYPLIVNNMSVMDNILMPLIIKNSITEEKIKEAKEYIKLLDLKNKQSVLASKLSGGERQKLSIIRALTYGGDVLIADEPTNDLDPNTVKTLVKIFKKLNEAGITIIMVTHAHLIAEQARTVYEMNKGKIVKTLK